MFTRRFDRVVRLVVGVLTAGAIVGTAFALYAMWPPHQVTGYEPVQPVPFSHRVMAGEAQIPCLYCHEGADRGPVAGIPTVATCMNCHAHIRPKDAQGQLTTDMAALLAHVDPTTGEPKRPIVWQKVHDLSDFAYFDHARHTVGARLDCAECHGKVAEMDRVKRVHSLNMGWCLDCHTKEPEPWRTDGRKTRGPIHCSTCHR